MLFDLMPTIGAIGAVILFIAYAVALFVAPELGLKISGHSEAGMRPTVAGRYLMMAILVATFWWLQDFRALMVVFAAFIFIAVFDAFIEPPRGGELWPHVTGAVMAAVMMYFYWSAWRGGDV